MDQSGWLEVVQNIQYIWKHFTGGPRGSEPQLQKWNLVKIRSEYHNWSQKTIDKCQRLKPEKNRKELWVK